MATMWTETMATSTAPTDRRGVPDWRDDAAYHVYRDRDRNTYRWEFLRRNPGYRRDWQACVDGDGGMALAAELRYSLPTMRNPASSNVPTFQDPDLVVPAWQSEGVLSGGAAALVDRATRDGLFLTAIDPSLSLEANIENITRVYREYEQEFAGISRATRFNRAAYPGFLRILDARDAVARFEDIKDYSESRPGAPDISVEDLIQKRNRAIAAAEKLTVTSLEVV